MPKEWKTLDDCPEEAQPLLTAYDEIFGLHNTNNVVRHVVGGEHPIVIIQRSGRMTAGQLRALEQEADCCVEVMARAPGYLLIILSGGRPASDLPAPIYPLDTSVRFLFREMP